MGDYGIKVSQRDYDVTDAKDYQLEYSSSFPMLPIVAQGSFTASPGDIIYTHNLGFAPLFFIFTNGVNNSLGFTGAVGQAHCPDGGIAADFTVSTVNLRYETAGASGDVTGRYFIFGINLATDFLAPVVNPDTAAESVSGAKNYGIRVSKDGADVFSDDLRDFTIHSGTRSPMLHQIKTGVDPNNTVTVNHDLGYAPFPLLYVHINALGRWKPVFSAMDAAVTSSDTDATFVVTSAANADLYSFVLLKEPLLVN